MIQTYRRGLNCQLTKYSKHIKAHTSLLNFTGCGPISILSFLEPYKIACAQAGFEEEISIQILAYIIDATPKQNIIAYLRTQNVT